MKIKVLVLAGVIGLTAQASNAATDTRCNPFLFGDCREVAAKASSDSVGQLFAAFARRSSSAIAPAARSKSRGRGSFMSRFARDNRVIVFGPRNDNFDENPIEIVKVSDQPDEGVSDEGVSVVPVPAAGFLLLVGLGGLAMMRRKKS